jgi:hypothetical protein
VLIRDIIFEGNMRTVDAVRDFIAGAMSRNQESFALDELSDYLADNGHGMFDFQQLASLIEQSGYEANVGEDDIVSLGEPDMGDLGDFDDAELDLDFGDEDDSIEPDDNQEDGTDEQSDDFDDDDLDHLDQEGDGTGGRVSAMADREASKSMR